MIQKKQVIQKNVAVLKNYIGNVECSFDSQT